MFVNTISGKPACVRGISSSTRHSPAAPYRSVCQRPADRIAGVLTIVISATCMQGPDAVSVGAAELDNGPVDSVKAPSLIETAAPDFDDATISSSFSTWPAGSLQAPPLGFTRASSPFSSSTGTPGKSALALAVIHRIATCPGCSIIMPVPVVSPAINGAMFVNTISGKPACVRGISSSTRHSPAAPYRSVCQRPADRIAGVLTIVISATCMQGPDAVSVGAAELDNGPVDLVIVSFL